MGASRARLGLGKEAPIIVGPRPQDGRSWKTHQASAKPTRIGENKNSQEAGCFSLFGCPGWPWPEVASDSLCPGARMGEGEILTSAAQSQPE